VLTSRYAAPPSNLRSAARVGAVLVLALMASVAAAAAQDGDISTTNCVGVWRSFNCVTQWRQGVDPYVRIVPEALDEAERARNIAADRKWFSRCRPVKTTDMYGVARYRYAAPGCEFGISGD
jgi:hypothetical protein